VSDKGDMTNSQNYDDDDDDYDYYYLNVYIQYNKNDITLIY